MIDRRAQPPSPILSFGVWMAALAGIMVWLTITAHSARHDAWDSPLYYLIGMPALALMSAVLAFVNPEKPWRYAVAPYAGQALVGLLLNPGNVFPLGLVVFPILCVPALVLAYLAAAMKAALSIRIRERRKRLQITAESLRKAKMDDIMRDLDKEAREGKTSPDDDMPAPRPSQRPR